MKLQITTLLLILTFFSCKEKTEKKSETEENKIEFKINKSIEKSDLKRDFEFSITEIDSLKLNGFLIEKQYSLMSKCGGGFSGFYFNEKLVFIDEIYKAELGFSKHQFYLKGNKFVKIIYQEHFPEDEKYLKKYPLEKFEYDERKMTFLDTIYNINLGINKSFRKISKGKLISTKIDNNLINELINCGNIMKKELETDTEQSTVEIIK